MYILKVDSITPDNNEQVTFINNNSYRKTILNENETIFINKRTYRAVEIKYGDQVIKFCPGDDISEIIFNYCKDLQREDYDLSYELKRLKDSLPNLVRRKIEQMSFIDKIKLLFKTGENNE